MGPPWTRLNEIYILLEYGHKDGYNCIKNNPIKRW
jgi:hypothetical protein